MNRFSVFNRAVFSPPNEGAAGAPAAGSSGSGNGSSSQPSASPASAAPTIAPGGPQPPPEPSSTPAASEPGPNDPSLDFQSIFDGPPSDSAFLGSEPAAPPPTAPAAAPAAPVAPAAPAPASPAAPVAGQPGQPQPATPGDGGQPSAATPPASGQSPVLDLYDPAVLAQGILGNEQATIDHVAATMFALTPEEVQALETDTVGTVQRLCARTFVKTNANMLMQLSRLIPTMIQRGLEDTKRATTNEDAFYTAWPQIDRQKHRDLVNRYGVTFRQMNPNTSRDEMIKMLGPLIMMAAGIPFNGQPQPAAPVGAQPQVHPAAGSPPAQNGVRPPPQSPFVPAVPGPGATGQEPQLEPWEAMFANQ
jgi:hypothetical protein